jgi:hypothetical protein
MINFFFSPSSLAFSCCCAMIYPAQLLPARQAKRRLKHETRSEIDRDAGTSPSACMRRQPSCLTVPNVMKLIECLQASSLQDEEFRWLEQSRLAAWSSCSIFDDAETKTRTKEKENRRENRKP